MNREDAKLRAELQKFAEYLDAQAAQAHARMLRNRAWGERTLADKFLAVNKAMARAATKFRTRFLSTGRHHPAPLHRL